MVFCRKARQRVAFIMIAIITVCGMDTAVLAAVFNNFSVVAATLLMSGDIASDILTINFSGDEDGDIVVDRVLHEAFEELGYSFSVDAQGISSAVLSADNGETDGLIAYEEGLEQKYTNLVIVPESIATIEFRVYARVENDKIFEKWDDLSGLTVGCLFHKPYLNEALPGDVKEVKNYLNFDALINGLKAGEIDVAIYQCIDVSAYVTCSRIKVAGNVGSIEVYPYVNKRNIELLDMLTGKIREMKQDGSLNKILDGSFDMYSDGDKSILYLSSYTSDMQWESELLEGIKNAAGDDDAFLNIHNVSVNSLRHMNDINHVKAIGNSLRREYLDSPPGVIMVSDDEAFKFLKSVYNIYFMGVPVVFFGINDYESGMIDGFEQYITGVEESISALETVELILRLFPDTEKLFILHDYSLSGQKWHNDIYKQLSIYEDTGRLELEFAENVPFSELLDKITSLGEGTVLLSGIYGIDAVNHYYLEWDSRKKIFNSAKVPIFGLISTSIGYGQIGGKYISAKAQGEQAYVLAKMIMSGKTVWEVPVMTETQGLNVWMFDYSILEQWGVSQSKLPNGTVLINKPMNIIEQDPMLALLVALIFVAAIIVIISLVYLIRALRIKNKTLVETQKSLHTAEELLQKDKIIEDAMRRQNDITSVAPILFLVCSQEGKILDCNKYAQDELGLSVGSNIKDFYYDISQRISVNERLNKHSILEGEILKFRIVNGEYHSFLNTITTIDYDGNASNVLWGVDIEELVQQNEIIKRAQSDLQRILDALPVSFSIYEIDIPHYPIYVNTAYLKMFGFVSIEEALGYSVADLSPEIQPTGEKSLDIMRHNLRKFFTAHISTAFEWQFIGKNGNDVIETKTVGSEILYKNRRALGFIIQDIAAEKMQAKMLQGVAEKEREANQMKSRFVINMSHEIRTPMNAIIGLSEIALMKDYEYEASEIFRKINMSSKNLLSIVNDVLDFSKIEAERLELIEEDFILEDVLANAVMVGAQRLDKKPVEMALKVALDIPQYLYGDRTRLWQILKNLLDNSAKFTEKGQIILEVTCGKGNGDCGSEIQNGLVREITFVVSDTGVGMTEMQLARIYMPFEQFHKNAQSIISGTGLGMSITKQLTELMGGSIVVESGEGVGTKTTITIPFRETAVQSTLKDMLAEKKMDGYRVLVADDNDLSREIMGELLKYAGSNPVCVANGEDALAAVDEHARRGETFDVVILDYLMNGFNGIEVAANMKNIAEHMRNETKRIGNEKSEGGGAETKLVLVSGLSKQLISEELSGVGFSAVIEKPFSPTSFISKIYSVIEGKHDVLNAKSVIDLSGYRVLLCEDNEMNQEVALSMLETLGIDADVANNGKEALGMLDKRRYDIVLMDIIMPVMNGHEATINIRKSNAAYKDIPIIALTANVVKEEIDICLQEGMNGHIGKPIDFNVLGVQLQKWLANGSAVNRLRANDTNEERDVRMYIEGVDIDKGTARFAGKRDRYLKVLLKFAVGLPDTYLPFEEAASEEKIKALAENIHTLKGVAGNLEVQPIYKDALEFEKTIRSGTPDKILYDKLIVTSGVMKAKIIEACQENNIVLG